MEIFNFPFLTYLGSVPTLTLDSGKNVGPTFINFGFFSINAPAFIDFWNFLLALWLFSSFIVVDLCLFKALRLLF